MQPMQPDQTTLTVLRPTPRKAGAAAGQAASVLSGIVADVQPLTQVPADLQTSPGIDDVSKYVWYHIFVTLDDNPHLARLPDIRNFDQLQDASETDSVTGQPALYHIRRAAPWWGDHIEIMALRLATAKA